MKKHFTFLIFLLTMSNLFAQTKDWTLLVYMVGSDIVQDAITDFGEMQAAGNTDNIHIVGMLGGSTLSGWETPATSIIVNGEEIGQSFVPSESNMANPTNITEFINWGVANYPAENYMLLFYNHGMDIRGFGWDNTVDHSNSVSDIQNGIGNSDFIQNGNKFEVIGFDACLMACFEVQSALRNFGHYYIASEETEPWHAWHWTPVIQAMNSQLSLDGAALGKIVVDTYMDHHEAEGSEHVTLSVSELSKITALESALEELLTSLNDDAYLNSFMRARAMSEEYHKTINNPEYSEDMVDIGDMVKHLKELEPTIAVQADEVLAKLDDAVVYERSDATRPRATGMSMYVPMNVFVDEEETQGIIDEDYSPIEFSDTIKQFITNDYLNFALGDDEPNTGTIDDDFGFKGNSGSDKLLGMYSALKVSNENKDLHQVQVVLLEEIAGMPDEFLTLGSTYPDTTANNADGTTTYAYLWDEEWLSLNGFPAYVADIQFFKVEDDNGNAIDSFTRIHLPAIFNPNTADEKEIMMSFKFDENFNHELEGILREPYGNQVMVPSKERIDLQPGDQVQLVYEIFNLSTKEAVFVADDNAIINIQSGNEDLDLSHSALPAGKYHLGFVLMDHSHNDTLIYDPTVREIIMSNNDELSKNELRVTIGPNPAKEFTSVNFSQPVTADINIYNSVGTQVLVQQVEGAVNTRIDIKQWPSGTYFLHFQANGKIYTEKFIKL